MRFKFVGKNSATLNIKMNEFIKSKKKKKKNIEQQHQTTLAISLSPNPKLVDRNQRTAGGNKLTKNQNTKKRRRKKKLSV